MIEKQKLNTVIVTGATGAIGKAISEKIAQLPGYKVILFARNEQKVIKTINDIQFKSPNSILEYKIVNLAEPDEIFNMAGNWESPVSVLINNAAIAPPTRMINSLGIEMQFATNVLGYFWMMKAFSPFLKTGLNSRIVNVASYWAGGLDLKDLEFKNRPYQNDRAYRQSKQANRMLSKAFSELLEKDGIRVNSCHPGDVSSNLSNSLGFGGHELPEQGAETPVWLATNEGEIIKTGTYYEHMRETDCIFSTDEISVSKLYNICETYY